MQIYGFVDSFSDEPVKGHEVVKVDDLMQRDLQDVLIVIASTYWIEIMQRLEASKFTNYVIFNHAITRNVYITDHFYEYQKLMRHVLSVQPDRFENVRFAYQFSASETNESKMIVHKQSFNEYECVFAAEAIRKCAPKEILDIGSHRLFLLGVTACSTITSVDVRHRQPITPQEKVITCDAKNLAIADAQHDMIISLCALEHFGLGCYGDAIDFDADRKALEQFVRVLKPGGHLVVTIPVSRKSTLNFNSFRVYTQDILRDLFHPLTVVDEQIVLCSDSESRWHAPGQVRVVGMGTWEDLPHSAEPDFHLYMGLFRKE